MADEHQTHDPKHDHTRQTAQPSPHTEATESVGLPGAALSLGLLGHPAIGGRGNGPVQIAAIQRLQQSVGNRAIQRLLAHTNVSVQRTRFGLYSSSSESENDSDFESEEEPKKKPKGKYVSANSSESENDSEFESEEEPKNLKRKYVSASSSESENEDDSDFDFEAEDAGPEPPEEFDNAKRTSSYPTSWSKATLKWAEAEAKRLGLCPFCTKKPKADLTARIPIPGKRAEKKRKLNKAGAAKQTVGFRRGYDIDHHSPKWADRLAAINEQVFQGKIAQPSDAILHRVYNSKVRVTCPGCNVSHAHEAKIKNFNIDDYDGKP